MSRRRLGMAAAIVLVALLGIYLANAPWLAPPMDGTPKIMAHRGVHQDFDRAGLTSETCTATRIREPVAPEIENTIESMRAAFARGAAVVEIDVHLTTDGRFAVFHDWTLDCRTEGHGETRAHAMAYLKTLDVGYGYTADGGRTFPLRGKGVGLMPSLDEVMAAFPAGRFLVNFKSNDPAEGRRFSALVAANPSWRDRIWAVYGGERPTLEAERGLAGLKGFTLASVKSCLMPYLFLGWAGHVPAACHDTIVPVPINYAWLLWGWPDRFVDRMTRAGSTILLRGPYGTADASDGVDEAGYAELVPTGFPGYVWTNDIGVLLESPAFGGRNAGAGRARRSRPCAETIERIDRRRPPPLQGASAAGG
jgi:glycerophosphoryl diester phosphodiesterase